MVVCACGMYVHSSKQRYTLVGNGLLMSLARRGMMRLLEIEAVSVCRPASTCTTLICNLQSQASMHSLAATSLCAVLCTSTSIHALRCKIRYCSRDMSQFGAHEPEPVDHLVSMV